MYPIKLLKKALAIYENSPMRESTAWTRAMNRQWRVDAMGAALKAVHYPVWHRVEDKMPGASREVWLWDGTHNTSYRVITKENEKFHSHITHWMYSERPAYRPCGRLNK